MPKDRMIMRLSLLLVIATFFVYGLHQLFVIHHTQLHIQPNGVVVLLLVLIPALLYIATWWLNHTGQLENALPWLHMLIMTFCSIGMIAAGYGMIEYHFSIFMVLAIISYYENIRMIAVMSTLFVAQHLLGFFYFTEYVFGMAKGTYSFTMLLYHALFLLGTSGALSWQILHKHRLRRELQTTMEEQLLLESLLKQMQQSSEQLATVSEQLQEMYSSTQKELELMAGTIQSVSEDAQHHSQFTSSTSEVVNDISGNLQQISHANVEVLKGAQQMSSKAALGQELMEHTMEQMQSLQQQCKEYALVVAKLHRHASTVQQIADSVKGFSKQTRMLSLNASIEAARAGVHGKGFAVVAAEVGKLAQQSSAATVQIMSLVADIKQEAEAAVLRMQGLVEQVEQGVANSVEMAALLHEINLLIAHSVDQFQLVSRSTEEIAAGTNQANIEISELNQIAQEMNTKAEGAANATVRQLELNAQLAPLVGLLNKISHSLKNNER